MANTIADKLTYLNGTKDAIKQAIIGKGVDVTDTDTFRSYADKITSIQSGGSLAEAPSGIRFCNSAFTTVPVEIIPYLEAQTDLSGKFMQCSSLESVPLFNTNRATDMSNMFNSCQSLKSVPSFDTSNVVDMHYMFSVCRMLTSIPAFNTSKVTTMAGMFGSCHSLETVPLLDVSNVDSMSTLFFECGSLINLGGFTGLKTDLNLQDSSLLTTESVMNVINNAENMTSSPRTLKLNQEAFNRLTQEQIATATAKGWNVASV